MEIKYPEVPALLEQIKTPGEAKRLAAKVNSDPAYLYQIATGRRRAGFELAQKIEKGTRRAVRKESLRPDVWGSNRTNTG